MEGRRLGQLLLHRSRFRRRGVGIISGPLANVVGKKVVESGAWVGSNGFVVALGIAWTVFILWTKRGRITEKIALQAGCQMAFRDIKDECHNILANEEHPNKPLVQLVARISEARKHHRDGFMVEPTSQAVFAEAAKTAADLVQQYKGLWVDQLGRLPTGSAVAPNVGGQL